jgi:hypothetical protein
MRVVTALLATSLITACATTTPIPNSGVEGQVLIGPMCPVIQEGEECPDMPFEADLEVTDHKGKVLARFESDEEGYFRIAFAPGEYILVPVSPNAGAPPWAEPIRFQVERYSWTKVTVLFDSGIR